MNDYDTSGFDDIVADSLPEPQLKAIPAFKPWHRVRKQFVRTEQWNKVVREMLRTDWKDTVERRPPSHIGTPLASAELEEWSIETSKQSDRPLRCLVLPGDDLLDMRSLCNDLADKHCFIKYLGYNVSHGSDQEGTRIHVANNAVTSHPRVLADSIVVQDRFEQISILKSKAYDYLKKYGPFHVVNLDFCDSLCPNTAADVSPLYKAIHALLSFQFSKTIQPWALFVTSHYDMSLLNVGGLKGLCKDLLNNTAQHSEFREAMESLSSVNGRDWEAMDGLDKECVLSLFCIAFGKWLLSLAQKASPRWSMLMKNSYKYIIEQDSGAVIISLAFRFTANVNPPQDESVMSDFTPQVIVHPSELDCAMRILTCVSGLSDVDSRLKEDAGLYGNLKEAKANLMEAAGYSKRAYLEWVSAQEA